MSDKIKNLKMEINEDEERLRLKILKLHKLTWDEEDEEAKLDEWPKIFDEFMSHPRYSYLVERMKREIEVFMEFWLEVSEEVGPTNARDLMNKYIREWKEKKYAKELKDMVSGRYSRG